MLTQIQIQKLIAHLKAGLPIKRIAKELGLSYNTFCLRMATSHKRVIRILVDDDTDVDAIYRVIDDLRAQSSAQQPVTTP